MFTPVKNEKMYVLVAEQIKNLIEEGKLKTGERLPSERELANQFGVSRSTVREALTALEILGMIEVKTGLGTFVSIPSAREHTDVVIEDLDRGTSPQEVFEARMIIEPKLARLAAQRATYEDIQELEDIIIKSDIMNNKDFIQFEKLDESFHLLIAKAAYNEALYKFEESINSERLGRLWGNLKLKSLQKDGRIQKYKAEHKEIFEAIKERNPAKAEQVVKKHLKDIKKHLFDD
ncbi:MAG: hypothetical protein HPY66_3370 [Firmicutes bacterium]|nr:hypothetical protein [Bacillota bacterium]MDI6706286.1 FadR/GntR family transcriptional regulator [Bacillota bacterium]